MLRSRQNLKIKVGISVVYPRHPIQSGVVRIICGACSKMKGVRTSQSTMVIVFKTELLSHNLILVQVS